MSTRSKNRLRPHEKASLTDRWSEIIFRALSARIADRWKFVSFRGPTGGESRGIVDLIAIRKDMSEPTSKLLERGDLFDVVLVQMKGGSARNPSLRERDRLRAVARRYHARAIVLFRWRRGVESRFYLLNRRMNWVPTAGAEVFG